MSALNFKINEYLTLWGNIFSYGVTIMTSKFSESKYLNVQDSFCSIMSEQKAQRSFRINEHIALKLEEGKAVIYVDGERFRQCKYLLLVDPEQTIDTEIDSIDEAAYYMSQKLERRGVHSITPEDVGLSAEQEFFGHCSNLHAWVEHEYDTRLLHSNLAFPLLKELAERGDSTAKKRFAEEIVKRFRSGVRTIQDFLLEEEYLEYLTKEELGVLLGEEAPLYFRLQSQMSEYLDICVNHLNSLNGILWRDDKIVELRLNDKTLTTIPEVVREFTHLEQIEIGTHHITEIPPWIFTMDSLRTLKLSYNHIGGAIHIDGVPYLEELSLMDNKKIEEFTLRNAPHLKKLNLSGNQLRKIELEKVPYLVDLSVSRNHLNGIDLRQVPNLKKLGLSQNPMTKWPRGFNSLKYMEYIFFDSTQISDLKPLLNFEHLRIVKTPKNIINKQGAIIRQLKEKGIKVF